MKSIDKIINRDLFLNAYHICNGYANSSILNDINILMLRNSFKALNEKKLFDYYDTYIRNDKFYGNPALFSSEVVQIPKGLNSFREYRFFDLYSMILYNSIGLLFYKICNNTLSQMNGNNDNVFRYVPTVFRENQNEKNKNYSPEYIPIKVDKDYRSDYSEYLKRLKDNIKTERCIIKLDLSRYFDSIPHNKLISLLEKYSVDSTLAEYNINKESIEGLKFYFESMMGDKIGIPQGRDNCFSDYFGDIYLRQFDFKVKKLCANSKLKFICMIRYVDDITLIFDTNENLSIAEHYKILSSVEQKISKFFLEELNLTINSSKTEYSYFKSDNQVKEYLSRSSKKVSSKEDERQKSIPALYKKFVATLKKFVFDSEGKFEFKLDHNDRENLKLVFNKSFIEYLCRPANVTEINAIISKIDLELTIDSMYIMIILFFIESKNKKIFFEGFKKNLNRNLNLFDKRAIHIAMLCYTQSCNLAGIRNEIKKSKAALEKDNYGKYLITLADYYEHRAVSYLDKRIIYSIISWRYTINEKNILPNKKMESVYNIMYNNVIDAQDSNDAEIQQLKDFVYYYRKGEWNLAYNSFYNFFHEICKIKFNRANNQYDINNMISDLHSHEIISPDDKLNLLKFADSRNFNSISHPSKNGKMSIKVPKEKLDFYINEVGKIINKVFTIDNNLKESNK